MAREYSVNEDTVWDVANEDRSRSLHSHNVEVIETLSARRASESYFASKTLNSMLFRLVLQ